MRFHLSLLVILLLLLAACSGRSTGSRDDKVVIATLNGPSSMALIKLIDSLERENSSGLKVVIHDEPLQVRKMMLDGSADFALLPATMAAILYNKGLDYRLLAIPVWGTLYLTGYDTTITTLDDLHGRRVNVMARGMTPDVVFRFLLEREGIEPGEDVRLDYSFPTHIELASAVAGGVADLAVMSEPMVSMVTERNSKIRILIDLNSEWERVTGAPMVQTALLASGSLTESDTALVEQVTGACMRSAFWVNSVPDSAARLIVKYGILPDVTTAIASIPRSNIDFRRARDIRDEIEAYFEIFYNMDPDITGGRIPDESFIF